MQVKLRILGILYLLLFVQSILTAQTTKESTTENSTTKKNIIVEGVVYDQTTRKPLAYANVALANNQIGTVTNGQGKFRLVLPMSYKNSFVKISYIGYKTVNFQISKITNQKKFLLPEDPRVLAEVTFEGLKTATILKKAFKKIPDNYYQKTYTSEGFYRKIRTKDKKEYIAIGEGTFKVYQTRPNRKNQVGIHKLRFISNNRLCQGFTPTVDPPFLLKADVVNHLKSAGFLSKKGRKEHVFQMEKVLPYEDSEVYVISFQPKKGLKKGIKKIGYQGKVWIDTKTFAFVYVDYEITPQTIQHYKRKMLRIDRLILQDLGIEDKQLSKRVQCYYKKIGQSYYLHRYLLSESRFLERPGKYSYHHGINTSYLVTAIQPKKTKPLTKEEVKKSRQWWRYPSDFRTNSAGYWNDYNILLPEISFTAVAKQLLTTNDALKAKEKKPINQKKEK